MGYIVYHVQLVADHDGDQITRFLSSNKFPKDLRDEIRSKVLDEFAKQVAKKRDGGDVGVYIGFSVTYNLQVGGFSRIEIREILVSSRTRLKSTDPIKLKVDSYFDEISEVFYFLDKKPFSTFKLSKPYDTLVADVKKRNAVDTDIQYRMLEK